MTLDGDRPEALFLLPDLISIKYGSACLPMGRRYRARQPRQALPYFPFVAPRPTPLGLRLAPPANRPGVLPLAGHLVGPGAKGRIGCMVREVAGDSAWGHPAVDEVVG